MIGIWFIRLLKTLIIIINLAVHFISKSFPYIPLVSAAKPNILEYTYRTTFMPKASLMLLPEIFTRTSAAVLPRI